MKQLKTNKKSWNKTELNSLYKYFMHPLDFTHQMIPTRTKGAISRKISDISIDIYDINVVCKALRTYISVNNITQTRFWEISKEYDLEVSQATLSKAMNLGETLNQFSLGRIARVIELDSNCIIETKKFNDIQGDLFSEVNEPEMVVNNNETENEEETVNINTPIATNIQEQLYTIGDSIKQIVNENNELKETKEFLVNELKISDDRLTSKKEELSKNEAKVSEITLNLERSNALNKNLQYKIDELIHKDVINHELIEKVNERDVKLSILKTDYDLTIEDNAKLVIENEDLKKEIERIKGGLFGFFKKK
jgi:hypothetical protein